jgi:hypothetical protein
MRCFGRCRSKSTAWDCPRSCFARSVSSLPLSQSHTHTHTHSLSLSLARALSPSLCTTPCALLLTIPHQVRARCACGSRGRRGRGTAAPASVRPGARPGKSARAPEGTSHRRRTCNWLLLQCHLGCCCSVILAAVAVSSWLLLQCHLWYCCCYAMPCLCLCSASGLSPRQHSLPAGPRGTAGSCAACRAAQ